VLCRAAEKRERAASSNAPLVALVAAVLLVGGTAFAFRLFGARPEPARAVRAAPIVREEAPTAPVAASPEPAEPAAATLPSEPSFPVAPAPVPVAVVEAPVASASAAPSAVASADGAPRAPSSAEVTAALRATPIVMFSTSWCGVCRQARAFLGKNGLAYTERDVERDAAAKAELARLTGETSVPAFLVDGKLVGPGFSEGSLKRALVASLERRLGVKAEVRSR
jgi:glutaredoxin